MKIFDQTGCEGNFETSTVGQPPNHRSFGIWNFETPQVGDLIIIDRGNYKAIYQIQSFWKFFTGSNSDNFWKGAMKDVVDEGGFVSREIYDALVKYEFPV